MINHNFKCIFVEVPKTGSTSIRNIIGCPVKPHQNITEIKNEIDILTFESYFKFAFVRNPWDRVVSLYRRKEGVQLAKEINFEQFVDWIELSSDTCIHPTSHKYQLDWLRDENKNVLVDFIGRFERLEEDWKLISKIIGVKKLLPHLNINTDNNKCYTEYYSKKTREIIYKKFHEDIEYFNYKFGD